MEAPERVRYEVPSEGIARVTLTAMFRARQRHIIP